ncbi:hypothetical protein QQP08_006599, partial [Theobroma cacao]
EKGLGHPISQPKVYDHTHKRSNGEFVDKKLKTITFSENSTYLEFDVETWHEIVKGVGHGQLYEFGIKDLRHILGTSRP